MRIKGKVAVVTGASSGIGRATALLLARHGAKVALVARREPLLSTLLSEIEGLGQTALVVSADVAQPAEVDVAFEAVLREFGAPDILVNSAGIGIWKPFMEITESEHKAMMDINYWGAFHWIRRVLPEMKKRGSGHVINISSGSGKIAFSVTSGYSASKFAMTGLSEALHREFLGTRINISCIHPGSVKTDFWTEENLPADGLPALARFSPKMSPAAVARTVRGCIWFGYPQRTVPVFVGLLTRVNALWIRLGDLMLWKWFMPILAVFLLYRIFF